MRSFFWLLLISCAVAMLTRRLRIPYAVALVIVGLLVGAPHVIPTVHLEPDILFSVLLPPLLFESALNLRTEDLKMNWKSVALLSVFGTLLSAAVVFYLSFKVLALPFEAALVFGALISSTDPVSVVAVFKKLGVGKRLSILVESESLFNDGIAVVLFGSMVQIASGGSFSLAHSLQEFIVVALGGSLFGAFVGIMASHITRAFDDHLVELMLTAVVAYGSYIGAESLHVSGVLAVVFAGLLVGNYGTQTGMSARTQYAVLSFWEFAAYVANSVVFLLIGIEVTFVNIWEHASLIAGSFAVVLLGRAVVVYSSSPIISLIEGRLEHRYRLVMWWGGLRGALSMALALGLSTSLPWRDTLVVMTFGVVLFSLILQGLSMGRIIRWLRLGSDSKRSKEFEKDALRIIGCRASLAELHRMQAEGVAPRSLVIALEDKLQTDMTELHDRIEALRETDASFRNAQATDLHRRSLVAAKSAVLQASRQNAESPEASSELLEEYDNQLIELEELSKTFG